MKFGDTLITIRKKKKEKRERETALCFFNRLQYFVFSSYLQE